MAGIYIHIPFCRKKCNYCDFHSVVSSENRDVMVNCLVTETRLQKKYLGNEPVNTIYFGGGTPSVLNTLEINKILNSLYRNYSVSSCAEITFEANPEDLSFSYIKDLKKSGINRLSIGIQSFFEDDLKRMNRRHNAEQSLNSVKLSKKAGIDNISIDLIYGIPGMDKNKWESNLKTAFSLPVKHLSAYLLTIEPKTVFGDLKKSGEIQDADENSAAEFFGLLNEVALEYGFVQYEISNFAKPGFFSRHNCGYWNMDKYIGIGPSASSFNGNARWWNVSDNNDYMSKILKGVLPHKREILDIKNRYNEYILTSLRTMWGVDINLVEEIFGEDLKGYCLSNAGRFIKNGDITYEKDRLVLTKQGQIISDYIISSMFLV